MPGSEIYKGDLKVNLVKGNTLQQLLVYSPGKIFQHNSRAPIAKA